MIWTLHKIEIFVRYFKNVWEEIFGQNDSNLDRYLFEIVENLECFRIFLKKFDSNICLRLMKVPGTCLPQMVSARIDSVQTDGGGSEEGDSDTANLVVAKNLKFEHYFSAVGILIWHDP